MLVMLPLLRFMRAISLRSSAGAPDNEDMPLANLAFPQLAMGPGVNLEHHELRELALATYANHDNAPLATTFSRKQKSIRKVRRQRSSIGCSASLVGNCQFRKSSPRNCYPLCRTPSSLREVASPC